MPRQGNTVHDSSNPHAIVLYHGDTRAQERIEQVCATSWDRRNAPKNNLDAGGGGGAAVVIIIQT